MKCAIFGCGGYLGKAFANELATQGYSITPFSSSSRSIQIRGKAYDCKPYSPLNCPPNEVLESDLLVNFCTEGVGHRNLYGVQTLLRNIEIVASCVSLSSLTSAKKFIHIGSYHESRLSNYCLNVERSLSVDTPVLAKEIDPYTISKSVQTLTISSLIRKYQVMANIVLTPNIFGPPNPANSLGAHLDDVAAGRSTLNLRHPNHRISSLSLQDFVSGLAHHAASLHKTPHSAECYIRSLPCMSTTVEEFAEWYLAQHPLAC